MRSMKTFWGPWRRSEVLSTDETVHLHQRDCVCMCVCLQVLCCHWCSQNQHQPIRREGGRGFRCLWSPGGGTCDIINFDLEGGCVICVLPQSPVCDDMNFLCVIPVTGDEDCSSSGLFIHTFKSHQSFGVSVRSVSNTHLLVTTHRLTSLADQATKQGHLYRVCVC